MFVNRSTKAPPRFAVVHIDGALTVEHDLPLRAAARAIFDACYPSDDWSPLGFDEAERFKTIHYRQAVGAAQQARAVLASRGEQLALPVLA